MAVETCQFRVAGVVRETGLDISLVIDAATKAAAEVKADQQGIDTTHIVPLHDPAATTTDHAEDQYAIDAAEARTTTPTNKLIEACVPEETVKPDLTPDVPSEAEPVMIPDAIMRPAYTTPVVGWTPSDRPSAMSLLVFALFILGGITAGGYFVLIHEPASVSAQSQPLVFGNDLYVDVIGGEVDNTDQPAVNANAFSHRNETAAHRTHDTAPPPSLQNLHRPSSAPALILQSVVVSHEGRFAILNGQLYKEGTQVAGCTLISVADDWVLMQWHEAQFVIQLKPNTPEPTQHSVRERQ